METQKISKEELQKMLESKEDFLLLDLMNPEFYSEKHIKGALNAPIYEVAFPEHVLRITEDKNKKIVVYDDNAQSWAREDAAAKLAELGFGTVAIYEGGLREWEIAGLPVEKGEEVAPLRVESDKYELDTEKSLLSWTGRNAKYAHHGKIAVKNGHLNFAGGILQSAEVVLDMTTIVDEDLTDPMWKGVLEKHLRSSDFFHVEKYPEAKFVLEKAEPILNTPYGTPNYVLQGQLTIKEVTRPLEIEAILVPQEDGTVIGQAHFDLDRTLWNVRYGSEKFFAKLGMHLVNDVISLEMFLVAKP